MTEIQKCHNKSSFELKHKTHKPPSGPCQEGRIDDLDKERLNVYTGMISYFCKFLTGLVTGI